MIVKVVFFASARDLAGTDQIAITLPDNANVSDLKAMLFEKYPEIKTIAERSAFSMNQEYVSSDQTPVKDGCEFAIIPPVSGG